MRKKVIHSARCTLIGALFLATGYSLHAQVPTPSSWDSFIVSSKNLLVSDTFRLQTFGDSEGDNWGYTVTGNTSITDKNYALKLPMGSSATFTPYSLSEYNNVEIHTYIRAQNLTSKKKLFFHTFRDGKTEEIDVKLDLLLQNKYQVNHITNNPSLLTIKTGQPDSSETCSFIIDSVYATGKIPSHSLFTGTGNWNDTTLWSHLPPLRHRSALIRGDVDITTDTKCKNAAISSGSLTIMPNSRLTLKSLALYGDDASLRSEGTIDLSDRITLHKTFEEAGKWYFISFPFDVYPSALDPQFKQKDATPNDGGNFLYVQTYNGDKRASTNQSVGNWEVLPICPDNRPLFEKNKGYLIALDEKATHRTLTFSSRPGDIPNDFANAGVLKISLNTDITPGDPENYGWYLCGNPLPAPLALSEIEKNAALDGYIYVYDGNSYKPYPLNSNYALPPFAAFFVKAASPTEINISATRTPTASIRLIRTSLPLGSGRIEPHLRLSETETAPAPTPHILLFIKEKQLHLHNIPEAGEIRLIDMAGRCILHTKIQQGSQVIPMGNSRGMYVLLISTPTLHKRYKIVIAAQ